MADIGINRKVMTMIKPNNLREDMEYQISFIVPTFNAEKYVGRCIDSLLEQDVCAEIVIVNDCSTDNTKNICEKYKHKNNNIKLINLDKNQGVSNARNIAISSASGKYLYFVDSDDYILKNSCLRLLPNSEDVDMVIFGKVYDHGGVLNKCKFPYWGEITKDKLLNENLDLFLNVHTCCWITNKLYSLKIIKENNLSFDNNLEFAEDLMFNLKYFNHCNKIVYKEEYVTFYDRNIPNSLSRKYEGKNISEVLKTREFLFNYLKEKDVKDFNLFYIDTKNILIYSTKKVLKSNADDNEKIQELNYLKKLDKNILKAFNNEIKIERLMLDYINDNNLLILRWEDEKI